MTPTRAQLVAEALTWRGTPYELNQCIKGAGVDCGRFIYAALQSCGLIDSAADPRALEIFGHDWSHHTGEERYRKYIFRALRNAKSILTGVCHPAHKILPGCIVIVHSSGARVADHGAIVIDWPHVLHAIPGYGVSECNAATHWLWAHKRIEAFDPFGIGCDAT